MRCALPLLVLVSLQLSAVLSKSQRRLIEVDVAETASEQEIAAAVDDYRAEFTRIISIFLRKYVDGVLQATNVRFCWRLCF